ncbi:hypothetical protein GGS20DRAFT_580703 [Poronia punctata]|nr:hypothetical protein GGS20DRAFT_580703 [Poronia punctata]
MEELPISPRGLKFQQDFISPSHEAELINIFRHSLTWPEAKKPGARLSLHYGYTFDYKTFGIDPDIPYRPFPDWLVPLIPKLDYYSDSREEEGEKEKERLLPDQVCLQYYPPGAGIPPHVDTHSAYDELYALSLGSPVVMQFRHKRENETGESENTEIVDVDLPPRSMMQMTGDSRLHWEHGIKKRKKDVLPDGTVRLRQDRWSITYRWLREGGVCECGDVRLCDTAQRRAGVEREYRWKQQVVGAKEDEEGNGNDIGGKGDGGSDKQNNIDSSPP